MSSDYDNLKKSGKLDETIGALRANLESSKIVSSPNDQQYQQLLQKYEEAFILIETMRTKIDQLQSNKLPTVDEVESMSAMLDVLNKLDIKTLDKLSTLGNKEPEKK